MDVYGRSGHMPLFEEVKQKMLEQIKNGVWTPDSMLPNELEVAAMFGVSQGTVRRAFRELVAQGILVRYQGRGTFVASQRRNVAAVRERINWFKCDEEFDNDRLVKHITMFERIPAAAKTLRLMDMMPGDEVFHIRRDIRLESNDAVICFDDAYLPASRFEGLTEGMIRTSHTETVYGFYEERFGLTAAYTRDVARAVLLNPEQAQLAQVPVPYPAIGVQRHTYTIKHELIELRFLVNVTEHQYMDLRSLPQ